MAKIYKDYEDRYVAANVIYIATVPSERKTNSKGLPSIYAFASEESCIRNGEPVNAVKIDKDTLLDRVLKGAVVCAENPEKPGNVRYYAPIIAEIHETSNEGGFTEITMSNGRAMNLEIHLVSSEANLDYAEEDAQS